MNVALTITYAARIENIPAMTVHGSNGMTNCYHLKDLANTALALANSSGLIVESYDYDAYGNVTIRNGSGTVIPTSAYGNRFLFQGREYDYTTQLYNFRARWYDPETGRWLSNDPIGISGGLNLYAFCGNDPVNYVDPMGLALVKNKTGRPVIVSGNVGSGRGSGDQCFAVIPPAQEGEDTCWGGNNPPAGYDTMADAINAFLGDSTIESPGKISDIDFFYQGIIVGKVVPAPSPTANGPDYPLDTPTKISGNESGPSLTLVDDGNRGVSLRTGGNCINYTLQGADFIVKSASGAQKRIKSFLGS